MNVHEAAGAELVPAKRRNLPNRILRAFDNAKHLQGLGRGAKDALAELCRFIPQNRPFDTIFAHKATIAARIGMSERSLYRHLATLQALRLITVQPQDRKSRNGRFCVARICLSRRAAALLGLIEAPEEVAFVHAGDAPPASGAPAIGSTPALPSASPASRTPVPGQNTGPAPVVHSLPSANLTPGHTLSVPTIPKHQPLQRTENGLPADLGWLTGNGVSRAGIFKLMGMAKTRAKRLSDIVTAVRAQVQAFTGGRLYAYLARLVAGPTDFSVAAAAERQRIADAEQERAYASKVAVFRERFRNVSLTNAQQNRLYVIDDRSAFVQVFGGPVPTTAPLNDLRQWIAGIETGRLVMATLATERRLRA